VRAKRASRQREAKRSTDAVFSCDVMREKVVVPADE
jgi:hypothetical protein